MNGRSQVITGVEFNCMAAPQGTATSYIYFNKYHQLANGRSCQPYRGNRNWSSFLLLFISVCYPLHQPLPIVSTPYFGCQTTISKACFLKIMQ